MSFPFLLKRDAFHCHLDSAPTCGSKDTKFQPSLIRTCVTLCLLTCLPPSHPLSLASLTFFKFSCLLFLYFKPCLALSLELGAHTYGAQAAARNSSTSASEMERLVQMLEKEREQRCAFEAEVWLFRPLKTKTNSKQHTGGKEVDEAVYV